MILSDNLRQLIIEGLLALRGDLDHRLKPIHRLSIYQAISSPIDITMDRYKLLLTTGKLVSTPGLMRYCNLQYLTAKYVLPVWDKGTNGMMFSGEIDPMGQILETVKGLLESKVDPIKANELYIGDYYYELDTATWNASYGGWLALSAAYKALGNVLGTPPFYRVSDFVLKDVDEYKIPFSNDSAFDAVGAYSVMDDDPPEVWIKMHFLNTEFKFEKQKRLKFWEWWLTEAVPAAWNSVDEQAYE